MTNGSEMTTAGNGNMDPGDVRMPNAVAYCFTTLTVRWDDAYAMK
jgi:hypothetical protein